MTTQTTQTMMLDNVQASHVRAMIAGRRAVPVDLLTALADLEPVV